MTASKKWIVAGAALLLLAVAAVFGVPRAKEAMEARKRAKPVVAMLRQGTYEGIEDAYAAKKGSA